MSDNKKIVRFDENNKLVIENDNAIITNKGITSKIEGVYEISDKDVEKLLVLINDNILAKPVHLYNFIEKMWTRSTQIITSDEAMSIVSKEYDKLMDKYKELTKKYDELTKECNELNTECRELRDKHMTMRSNFDNLLEKIKRYNKNRLFKLKID